MRFVPRVVSALLILFNAGQHPGVAVADRRSQAAPTPSGRPPALEVQTGHTGTVQTLTVSSDGLLLATGGWDGRVLVWDTRSRKQLRSWRAPGGPVNSIALAGDGRLVAATSGEVVEGTTGHVTIWHVETGDVVTTRQLKKDHVGHAVAFVGAADSYAVLVDGPDMFSDGGAIEMHGLDGLRKRTVSLEGRRARTFSVGEEGKLLVVGGSSSGAHLDRSGGGSWESIGRGDVVAFRPGRQQVAIAAATQVSVVDVATGGRRSLAPLSTKAAGTAGRVVKLVWTPDGGLIAAGTEQGFVVIWDGETGQLRHTWSLPRETTNRYARRRVSGLAVSADGLLIAATEDGPLSAWDIGTALRVPGFDGTAVHASSVAVAPDGAIVALLGDSIRRWRLDRPGESGVRLRQINGDTPAAGLHLATESTGRYLAVYRFQQGIDVLDAVSGELRATARTGNLGRVRSALSPDGAQLTGETSLFGPIDVMATATGKPLLTLQGHTRVVNATAYTPDGQIIVTGSGRTGVDTGLRGLGAEDDSVRLWSARDGRLLRTLQGHRAAVVDLDVAANGRTVASASDDGTVRLWSTADGTLLRSLDVDPLGVTAVAFSPDGDRLTTGDRRGALVIWNARDGARLASMAEHSMAVEDIVYSADGTLVISTSLDATVRLRDAATGELKATIVAARGGGHVIISPDGRFAASEGGVEAVGYRIGTRGYAFDQFDYQYNRPDEVYARLGRADVETVRALERARQSRLARAGGMKVDADSVVSGPSIRITEALPHVTIERVLRMRVRVSDPRHAVTRIHVDVNGVPAHGPMGIDVSGAQGAESTHPIAVELSAGTNIVQVSAANAAGVEGAAERFVVTYAATPPRRLHILAIGVSRYADARMSLRYASKDATDVARLFTSAGNGFSASRQLVLADADATRDRILDRAAAFLADAELDDLIILFLAGHGVLDSERQYRFAPYDMDFDKPASRGLTVEMIEAIVGRSRARQKLVLIDSCHVGEILVDDAAPAAPGVTARVPDTARGVKPPPANRSVWDLSFVDVRRGTGAVILGAAGGLELAFEGQGAANGVFTHTLLTGIRKFAADRDGDRSVRVSELRYYLAEEVVRLTSGRQRPLVRRQNLASDFAVFTIQ
jgi:WD40 repeat protein